MSGFLRRAYDKRERVLSGLTAEELFSQDVAVRPGYNGRYITPELAMNLATVNRCVRVLSDGVAQLPLMLYRPNSQGAREQATDHPLWTILHDKPNRLMSPFAFKQTLFRQVLLRGNAYGEIEWKKGYPAAVWPLRSENMKAEVKKRRPEYDYTPSDKNDLGMTKGRIADYRVHHLRGLSGDGFLGHSPVQQARLSLDLALSTEEYGGRFFHGDATPTMALSHPMALSAEAKERISDSWSARHKGLERSHKVAVLEEGMTVERLAVPPEEAQFLGTREFQTVEICRWFGVPPHMVYDLTRATFSNIEHQSIAFLNDSLLPWLIAHEQQIRIDMLERNAWESGLWAEYKVDGRLRGDTVSRYRAYQIAVMYGLKNRNEIRRLENDPPYEGGDEMLVPANLAKAKDVGKMAANKKAPQESEPDGEARSGALRSETRAQEDAQKLRDLWAEAVDGLSRQLAGVLRSELEAVRAALGRQDLGNFLLWLDGFHDELVASYGDALASRMRTLSIATARAAAGQLDEGWTSDLREQTEEFAAELVEGEGHGYAGNHRRQLEALVRDAESEELARVEVEMRMLSWEETEADKRARELAFKAGNAVLMTTFAALGIIYHIWSARGDACPYCRALDGKRVAIGEDFVSAGDEVEGGDGAEPMRVSGRRTHAPLHGGCDCTSRPEREEAES